MKPRHLFIFTLIAATTAACGNSTKNEETNDSIWQAPVVEDRIHTMSVIDHSDTFRVENRLYEYHYHFAPADSLPIVTNADGTRYNDNTVLLTIKRDSTVIFNHRFTKASFAELVPASNLKTSALAGFSYNLTKTDDHTQLRFIATVGDPDETAGINFPIEILVKPSGQFSLQPAEDIETEPLIEGLNVDPSQNGQV